MTTEKPTPPEQRDSIAALLRSAGPRMMPDPTRMLRAEKAVQAEWRSALGRRRQVKLYRLAAVVASLGIGLWLLTVLRPGPAVPVATVVRVTGNVSVRYAEGEGGQAHTLVVGQAVKTGTQVDTNASGRALLKWASGIQARIDLNSLVHVESAVDVRLEHGAVYIETSADGSHAASLLTVSTPFGAVRHVGTRFEVRVDQGSARVRVRDGLASFSGEGRPAIAVKAGQQLSVSGTGLVLEAGPGSADPDWGWVREISPPFTMEGRSLFDTLAWLSQESGLRVVYRGGQARARAREVTLRGSIEGLDTRQALLAVLAGSDLAFEMYPDRVEIRLNAPR